jgi:prolipoprotein diacylglyceryltransferase
MTEKNKQSNFQTIFLVALTCILTGAFVGATTNMINGAVSPYYFKAVMYWDFQDIWTASVAQGILEGLLYGVIFAIIFTTGFGVVTKGQAPYSFAFRQLLKIIVIVFTCWTIGGLLAMFLVTLSPEFYKAHFPYTPSDKTEMLKFAWVGGSIWGVTLGGLLTAILGVVVTKNSWTKELTSRQ